MKIKSIDTSKDFTLKDNVFKVAMNSQAVYQSVVAEMNNARQGTSSSKNRSLVSGGGKYYFKKVNAKTKQLAFKCILSDKVKNDSFKVVESFPNQPRTKEFISFLRKNNLDGRKLTIISSVIDDNLSLASRNVPYVSLVKANSCSVKDLFDNELILVDVSGLEDLSNRFGGKN